MKCCLCKNDIDIDRNDDGEVVWDQGHNAEPLIENGRCCTECNWNKVIPARIGIHLYGDLRNEVKHDDKTDPGSEEFH